ncbi:hypothetical protein K438DRAFT_1749384 [Mycena galopus ATCC 62051]|nr:hypothetical protein K438DRAFT_1749384 [Mycena galopus ATCC 62051]
MQTPDATKSRVLRQDDTAKRGRQRVWNGVTPRHWDGARRRNGAVAQKPSIKVARDRSHIARKRNFPIPGGFLSYSDFPATHPINPSAPAPSANFFHPKPKRFLPLSGGDIDLEQRQGAGAGLEAVSLVEQIQATRRRAKFSGHDSNCGEEGFKLTWQQPMQSTIPLTAPPFSAFCGTATLSSKELIRVGGSRFNGAVPVAVEI